MLKIGRESWKGEKLEEEWTREKGWGEEEGEGDNIFYVMTVESQHSLIQAGEKRHQRSKAVFTQPII
jgi:hypothetical protein